MNTSSANQLVVGECTVSARVHAPDLVPGEVIQGSVDITLAGDSKSWGMR